MNKLLIAIFMIGCSLGAVVQEASNQPQGEMNFDFITMPDEQHKSWCTVKAWWKYRWCIYKPKGANWNDAARKDDAIKACNITHKFDVDNCNKNRLLNGELDLMDEEEEDYEDEERRNLQDSEKRLACLAEANVKANKCLANKKNTKAFCGRLRFNLRKACPARKRSDVELKSSERALTVSTVDSQVSKHKSWCTFKAWTAKQWRKKNRIFKNDAEKAQLDAQNEAQYRAALNLCATRRLMKGMDESMKTGVSHKSWCLFKSKMDLINCNTQAAYVVDSSERQRRLQSCNSQRELRNAQCSD